ncbi:tRNA1(Val) (adenine(37)-N6)-methyltransferase [Caproiciproducens faecalis]|uniref:Methyltransferase n=1 Tax=Caproiciproducens faecalis TaxID=2820301 RepID=A0ABS7DNE3_9FIRM|nr:methyltransferase [Caproiciproducens faecalis]MBW7572808.1 methyltransferase [Caproiciproducens faecalis]
MLLPNEYLEPLSREISVIVSQAHRFSTDTILLAAFSLPKTGEICADFGTGCGAIPLIWSAKSKPKKIYGIEIQEDACEMARRSVELNRLTATVELLRCDMTTIRQRQALPANGFDLIACNPPYKAEGAGLQNPEETRRVARHEVACSFADIARSAAYLLRFGGRFCCCLRPERLCGVLLDLRAAGLEPKRLRLVQQRADKAPSLFLLQATRGGKPGMVIDPVLLIEDGNGYSEEMRKIYGEYAQNKGAAET